MSKKFLNRWHKLAIVSIMALAMALTGYQALAALTLGATSVSSDGAITITGATASTWSTSAGALTLTSAGAATWSTAAGALTVDSAAALNLGTTNATSVSLGKTGITTTNNGAFTVTQAFTANGAVTLGDAAADVITVTGTVAGASPLTFAGGAAGGNVIFAMPDPASDITLTFPGATGTLATLAGTETLSGKTLTAPKFANAGFIADASGNELIIFTTTASAVNELTFANAAAGGYPTFTATGSSTDIGLNLSLKADGRLQILSSTANSDVIQIKPAAGGGATATGTITSADLGSNITWTLPEVTGTVMVGATSTTATQALFATGTAGAPAYRAIADADVPNTITIDLATAATNLAGGSGGTIHYQSAAATTAMLANGTAGQVLQSNGTTLAPSWVTFIAALNNASAWTALQNLDAGIAVDTTNFTVSGTTGAVHTAGDFDVATNKFTVAAASGNTVVAGTLNVTGAITGALTGNASTATALAGGAANQIAYQTGAGATGFLTAGTDGKLLVVNGAGLPVFVTMSGDVSIINTGATTIGAGAVTRAKMSTAGASKDVPATSATVATTGNTDTYVIVPQTGTLTGVDFSGVDALAASDTNYITWTITNLGQAGAGATVMLAATDANTTKTTGGTALAANTKRSLTLTGTGADLNVTVGDRLRIRAAATGTLANTVTFPTYMLRFGGTN